MSSYSGKFVLRLPPVLHQKLAGEARSRNVSLNRVTLHFLEAGMRAGDRDKTWLKPVRGILPALKRKFGNRLLGLLVFGSQVSGEATAASDIDGLVVLDKSVPLRRALYSWWDDALPPNDAEPVNPHFVHLPENPRAAGGLWFEVALNHETVYQGDGKVGLFLSRLLQLLQKGAIKREFAYGQPYWVWGS